MHNNNYSEKRIFDISRYDEEVQAVMTKPPGWMTRWGSLMIFLGLCTIGFISWFIKYPDIVKAGFVLSSFSPPVKMVANQSGRIDLMVQDGDSVKAGQIIGYIENPTRLEEVLKYLDYRKTLAARLQYGDFTNLPVIETMNLGDLQNTHIALTNSIGNFNAYMRQNRVEKNIKALNDELKLYAAIDEKLQNQSRLFKMQNELAQSKFMRDSLLYEQKVISKQEFENSKNSYLPSQATIESSDHSLKSNQLRVVELKKQLNELTIQEERYKNELRNDILMNYNELERRLHAWKLQYLFESPVDGVVALFEIRSDNEYVAAGKEVMSITQSEKSKIVGVCTLPPENSAKVQVGQKVSIELLNYPATEYGFVEGKVKSISPVPKEGNYYVVVEIPEKSITNHKQEIYYQEQMTGIANIETEDLRLAERFFYKFKKAIQR